MPTLTRRPPRWFRPRKIWTFLHVPRPYFPADTTIEVIVAPDDFGVIVDEETYDVNVAQDDFGVIVDDLFEQYVDTASVVNLVDENGVQLVDENGAELVVIQQTTGMVYTVNVAPDDFGVIVEQDLP